jgi:hypothetical protein
VTAVKSVGLDCRVRELEDANTSIVFNGAVIVVELKQAIIDKDRVGSQEGRGIQTLESFVYWQANGLDSNSTTIAAQSILCMKY